MRLFPWPLRDPNPGEGGNPSPAADPSAAPAVPPAAKIVKEGEKTERELTLEKTLKDRETRLSELEDENRRLKTPLPPAHKQDPAPEKKGWIDGVLKGATLFDEDEPEA
jgi:hypothetical protein